MYSSFLRGQLNADHVIKQREYKYIYSSKTCIVHKNNLHELLIYYAARIGTYSYPPNIFEGTLHRVCHIVS